MNYTLSVTETNNKAARYHYQVRDENGNLISERKSNRKYVACTIDGNYYFGRLDLIGKGDHGKAVKAGAQYTIAKFAQDPVTIETLLEWLANATKTHYGCSGHSKAAMNELRMKDYKQRLLNAGATVPDNDKLLEVGVFNGPGSY